jgi:DNA-binding response OmpR family regulator
MAAVVLPALPPLHREGTDSRTVRLVEPSARILSVSADEADHVALRRIINRSRWRLVTAGTCAEAIRSLCNESVRVVFCERSLPDGEWQDVLSEISKFAVPPRVAVVSRLADERLWLEVLNLGGHDVLSKPLVEDELRNVLGSLPPHSVQSALRPRLSVVRSRSGA